jgi:hypothetical protein
MFRIWSDVVQQHSQAATTALLRLSDTSIINEDLPQQLRRDAKEMCAIAPLNGTLISKSHVQFVDQSRWLHGVIRSFVPHPAAGELFEFRID